MWMAHPSRQKSLRECERGWQRHVRDGMYESESFSELVSGSHREHWGGWWRGGIWCREFMASNLAPAAQQSSQSAFYVQISGTPSGKNIRAGRLAREESSQMRLIGSEHRAPGFCADPEAVQWWEWWLTHAGEQQGPADVRIVTHSRQRTNIFGLHLLLLFLAIETRMPLCEWWLGNPN